MERWKKILLGVVGVGAAYYLYNGYKQIVSGGLVVGNLKFSGFEGLTKIRLKVPISNISNLPVNFKGFASSIKMKVSASGSLDTVGYANITGQQQIIAPNETVEFSVLFEPLPNFLTSVLSLIRSRSIKDLGAECHYTVTSSFATISDKTTII